MMQIFRIQQDWKREAAQIRRQAPDRSHAPHIFDYEVTIVAPDGSDQVVLLKDRIPVGEHQRAFTLLNTVDDDLSNRGSVVGVRMVPDVGNDGKLGSRNRVPGGALAIEKGRQGMLGYRIGRDGKCCKTPLYEKRPELLDENRPLIELADALYAKTSPKTHDYQWSMVASKPCCRLWNRPFSNAYAICDKAAHYHTDRGNLPGVVTVLMPMGNFTGGEILFPRWGIGVAFKPGDVLLFNPGEMHGILPFEGDRLSLALYLARRIANWGM
jgi:hypothetical protein